MILHHSQGLVNVFMRIFDMNLHDFDIMTEAAEEATLQKAVEDALTLIRDYNATPETAAEKMGAPLDKVLEALKEASLA